MPVLGDSLDELRRYITGLSLLADDHACFDDYLPPMPVCADDVVGTEPQST